MVTMDMSDGAKITFIYNPMWDDIKRPDINSLTDRQHVVFDSYINYKSVDSDKQLIVHPFANNMSSLRAKYSIGYDPCSDTGSSYAIIVKRGKFKNMENKELSWIEQAEAKCLEQMEADLQQFLSDIFDVKQFQNQDKNLVAWTESEELVDDFNKAIANDIPTTTTHTTMDSKEVTDI